MQQVIADVGLDRFMDEMIAKLTYAFRRFDPEATVTKVREGFSYEKPDLGLVEWMPTMDVGGRISIKTVGYHPTNPMQRNLPSVMATTSLHDTTTGQLLALADSTFLTAVRTGAASAVATDELAPLSTPILGIIGAGAQAITQAHAISRVRAIEKIIVFDADEDVAASFERRLPFAVEVEVVTAARVHKELPAMLGEADILCTCTSVDPEAGPVFADGRHKEALHINAVGADFPGKLEIPRTLINRAVVVPDYQPQCLAEGESQTLRAEQLGPDLHQLIAAGRHQYRGVLTVFDSTGWALEDLLAAELLLEHADRISAGHEIELQPSPRDPFDPYEQIRPAGHGLTQES